MGDDTHDYLPVGARLLPAVDLRLWLLLVCGAAAAMTVLATLVLLFGGR